MTKIFICQTFFQNNRSFGLNFLFFANILSQPHIYKTVLPTHNKSPRVGGLQLLISPLEVCVLTSWINI